MTSNCEIRMQLIEFGPSRSVRPVILGQAPHAAGRRFGATFLLGQSGFVHSRTLTRPVRASIKISSSFPHCAQCGLPSVDMLAHPFTEQSGHSPRKQHYKEVIDESAVWLSSRRHDLRNDGSDRGRFMLSASTFERIGTLEGIWSENRHLPSVIRLRSKNRNAPVSVSFRKHMFDHGLHVRLTLRIAGNCASLQSRP